MEIEDHKNVFWCVSPKIRCCHREGNYCQFSQYLMASLLSLFSGNKKIYVKQNKKAKKQRKKTTLEKNVIISPLIT